MTIIIFLIVLAVLIFVHELGHFLVARAFGIRVDEFALGFGPRLWSKAVHSIKHGVTTYSINLIPFGGYVKIFGENPDADSMVGPDSARSFVHKPKYVQAAVLVAGVFFNFLFAWLIFSTVFLAGFPASRDSYPEYADRIKGNDILITYTEPGSPAEKAGLLPGDSIVSVSIPARSATHNIESIQDVINQSNGKPLVLTYTRGGSLSTSTLIAKEGIVPGKFAVGIAMADAGVLKLPVHLAVWEGGRYVINMIWATITGLWDLLYRSFHGTANLKSISGPVGIAGLVGDAARLGFTYLLVFTALISINLGVLNLVPFPALDGGRLLFVIIEAVFRRPIKPTIANALNTVGFALLIILMLVVTYHDIAKIIFK